MAKLELATITMPRKQVEELEEAKIDKASKMELIMGGERAGGRHQLIFAKILLEQLGKEKAKEVIRKTYYDINYKRGVQAAKERGNPEDIDSFVEWYCFGCLQVVPQIPPIELRKITEKRYIYTCPKCTFYDAVQEIRKTVPELADPDIQEVMSQRCEHDIALANGFNPKMKSIRTKFFFDGDGACEFDFEVE